MKIIDFSMKVNASANEEEEEEDEEEEEEEERRRWGALMFPLAHHPSACSFQGIRNQFELLSGQAALDASIRGRLALHPSHHLCTCNQKCDIFYSNGTLFLLTHHGSSPPPPAL